MASWKSVSPCSPQPPALRVEVTALAQQKRQGFLLLFLRYIEKAIRFYSGYLDTKNADSYLPRVLSDVLEGKLGALGSRIGRMLFKLAVELHVSSNFIASNR